MADGDTITVYVDTADPRESGSVPREVHEAAIARAKARAVRNYQKADALQKTIVDAGYRLTQTHMLYLSAYLAFELDIILRDAVLFD